MIDPQVLWFTGLSGSGKTSLAKGLIERVENEGYRTNFIDGDELRRTVCKDLGFSNADRSKNVQRASDIAFSGFMSGKIVFVSLISPFKEDRDLAKQKFPDGKFTEIFVDCSFGECARRDTKGLYKKAINNEIKNFTGLDSPYEKPEFPDLHIDSEGIKLSTNIEIIFQALKHGRLKEKAQRRKRTPKASHSFAR